MKKLTNSILKIFLGLLAVILLWIIMMGIFDYDTIVYTFNPFIVIVGIVIYILLILLVYNKLLPKIENNKYIPYIFMRSIYSNKYYCSFSIKSKS